jgi:hypothetical protein
MALMLRIAMDTYWLLTPDDKYNLYTFSKEEDLEKRDSEIR